MLDKKVMIQFIDKRIKTLEHLLKLESINSHQHHLLQGRIYEAANIRNDIIDGKYDAKVW
ncbi:hypothetical protein [uncultured Metabacillus sp.]|uniref:hypothetical protein n=1 Tax=uncultured Metabacillus sp. TaxID=2860135 RepID=UPI0026316E66|nr:hypothetical protein [uncultured Metabacillus sp.]